MIARSLILWLMVSVAAGGTALGATGDVLGIAKADVTAVFTTWNYTALMARVDPLVVRNVSADERFQRRATFSAMAAALGGMRTIVRLAKTETHSIETPLGTTQVQTFDGKLAFANGTAKLHLQLAKRSQWLILGYNLTSAALPNGLATAKPLPK